MKRLTRKRVQKWGMWKLLKGNMVDGTPIRIMFQLPYDWHLTHNGDHTRKYWAKRRKAKDFVNKALAPKPRKRRTR